MFLFFLINEQIDFSSTNQFHLFCFYCDLDRAEPDEDTEVTRAKFFIRDEFLVGLLSCSCSSIDNDYFVFAENKYS